MEYNPTEPNNVYEFQGGSFDGWCVIYSSVQRVYPSFVTLGVAPVTTIAQYLLVPTSSEASGNTVLQVQCAQSRLL